MKIRNGWEIAGAIVALAALGLILHNGAVAQGLAHTGAGAALGALQIAEGAPPSALQSFR